MRQRATQLKADGVASGDIRRTLGLPRNTVAHWQYGTEARRHREDPHELSRSARCDPNPGRPDDVADYPYRLGVYLCDGYRVTAARFPVLRILCADAWPDLIDRCEQAMLAVSARTVQLERKPACVGVRSYSKRWPCVVPQHGPGKTHNSPIQLTDWQQPIVGENPGSLARGLLHSDRRRVVNRIVTGDKTHTYPRYMFANSSADIMRPCQESLDRLGISWTMCRPNQLSVARRAAVAALELHVGPEW